MKWHEVDTIRCDSGSVVILSKENFDRLAPLFEMSVEELLDVCEAVEVDLGCKGKIIGVDMVYPVHQDNVVTDSVLIHAYPYKFKRFLQKNEMTFAEYKEARPDGDYANYLGHKVDQRSNPDLDRILGILPEEVS